MTAIDHAAEARSVLAQVGSTPMTSEAPLTSVTAAQVHATLALVEQQRIANLQREREEARYQLDAANRDDVGSDAKNKKLMAFIGLNNDVERGLGLR